MLDDFLYLFINSCCKLVRDRASVRFFASTQANVFGYNARSEACPPRRVTSAAMRNGTSSYSFNQIGNRTTVNVPEDPNPQTYVANALNQYTSITGGTASSLSYDDDGNMTSDGAGKTHTWTGENRLEVYTLVDITVETKRGGERSRSNERWPEGWKAKGMAFHQNTYDGQGRRVRKLAKDLGAITKDLRYMYDDWNLLYEVDMHQVGEPTRRYVCGLQFQWPSALNK